MQYLIRSFVAVLAALTVAGATGTPAYAKSHAQKKVKNESTRSDSFSAIDETNTELSSDESNFASAKPEKHRAATAQEDPINAMAQAIRHPASPQHRNTSIGNSSDLQPFTDLEFPR